MAKSIFSNLTDPAYQQQAGRGQFYRGLGPLGAALIAAGQGGGAPGSRGPMVAQALGQFSQQAFDPNMAQRMNIQGIQGQAAEASLAKTQSDLAASQQAATDKAARDAAMVERFPSLAPFMGGGIPAPQPTPQLAPQPGALPPAPAGTPAPIAPVETQPLEVPRADIIGGAAEDIPGGHPFDDMPIEAVQYLAGSEDRGLASMATQYLKTKQARAGGGAADIGSQAQFRTLEGETVRGFFDKKQRGWFYRDRGGQEQRMPYGAKKITPTSSGAEIFKAPAFHKLRGEMYDTEVGVQQLQNYFQNVAATGGGMDSLVNSWKAKARVVFGEELGDVDYAALAQTGQLQGLLGKFRKEIVGGGVMTEFDAKRVLQALGGEPNPTRHPEIVRRLLAKLVKAKVGQYNKVDRPMFNAQVEKQPGTYDALDELQIPDVFSTKAVKWKVVNGQLVRE